MAMRDVNVFEKHAEKIVLGVAFAGAAFMGYLAMQKVTVENDIGPAEVEHEIEKKIFGDRDAGYDPDKPAPGTLLAVRKQIKDAGTPKVAVTDYVAQYKALAQGQPLGTQLADLKVPLIGPTHLSPTRIDDQSGVKLTLKPPDPVQAQFIRVEATQYQIAKNALPPGAVLQPGMVLPNVEQKVVVIDGWIPVGQMVKQMLDVKDVNARIPPDRARVIVQNIRVTRSEVLPTGVQTPFSPIEPTKAVIPPVEKINWGAIADDDAIATVD